jgi:hypothetical protein
MRADEYDILFEEKLSYYVSLGYSYAQALVWVYNDIGKRQDVIKDEDIKC